MGGVVAAVPVEWSGGRRVSREGRGGGREGKQEKGGEEGRRRDEPGVRVEGLVPCVGAFRAEFGPNL